VESSKLEWWWIRYRISKWRYEWKDLLASWVANRLPKRVVYFAYIRVWARITVPGPEHWGKTVMDDLPMGEVLTRWQSYYLPDLVRLREEAERG
jgi:hypothetical protein